MVHADRKAEGVTPHVEIRMSNSLVSIDRSFRSMWHSPGCCGRHAPLPPSSTPEQSQVDEPQMAGDGQSGYLRFAPKERPRDLTLANFFSAGWDDEWAKQVRATGTPNMALLRVQTNFMEREFRANYYLENNVASKTTKNLTDFDAPHRLEFQSPPDVGNHRRLPVDRSAHRLGRKRRHSRPGGPISIDRHRIVVLFLQFQGRRAQSGVGGDPDHVQLRLGRIRGPGLLVRPRTSRVVLQLSVRQLSPGRARRAPNATTSATTLPWPRPSPTRRLRCWAI